VYVESEYWGLCLFVDVVGLDVDWLWIFVVDDNVDMCYYMVGLFVVEYEV